MKNKEKYAEEIMEIACGGYCFGINKCTNEVVPCSCIRCCKCMFNDNKDCIKRRKDWAESEYIEKLVISKRDRAFLEYIRKEYKFIARDKDGELFIYRTQPRRNDERCNWTSNGCISLSIRHNVDFPMVKWGDCKPWFIEDLKKLEVVEEYD